MNSSNTIFLCSCLGGSHSYGLNTPTSDIDNRGVYIINDIDNLIGLSRNEMMVSQKEDDNVYTEFRHFLKLLRGGNTQMIELLFNDNLIFSSPFWEAVKFHRLNLIDSTKLFSCLRGYMQGELRLANGERTGKLGGKRKESIDKFGFSPKNFVQLLRLAWAGSIFFEKDYFPVNVFKEDKEFGKYLMQIKTQPETFTKEVLNEAAKVAEEKLVNSFESRKNTRVFINEVANSLCLNLYRPYINKL